MMEKMKTAGLCVVLCLLLVFPAAAWAAPKDGQHTGKISINNGTGGVPKCKAGEKVKVKVQVINKEAVSITNIRVSLVPKRITNEYPFEIQTTELSREVEGSLESNKSAEVSFELETRPDVSTDYPEVYFDISYDMTVSGDSGETVNNMNVRKFIFVRTIAADPEPTEEPSPEPTPAPEPPQEPDGGGYDSGGGGVPSDDSGDDKKDSTPRVIIEGFRTEPAEVNAGDTFKLTIKVRNTSKKTAVGNMVITLQTPQAGEGETAADAFLPVDGSSTLYIESIPKNSTKEISLDMTARTDLVQKPYPVEAAMKYEDESATQFEGTASISIPVRQKARFELSRVTVMPEAISVGEETNVTFEIYNLGKTKLYNVSVRIEDPSIVNAEAFVGNLDSGATGIVDMMAMGAAESPGDGTVKLLMKYEDQDGNQEMFESSCIIFVNPAMMEEIPMGDPGMEGMEEEQPGGSAARWVLGGAGVAAVVAAAVALVKRKRKKEKEWVDEILGSDKDELR